MQLLGWLSEAEPIKAWVSLGRCGLSLILPYSLPKEDTWEEDFARKIAHGKRVRVFCLHWFWSKRTARDDDGEALLTFFSWRRAIFPSIYAGWFPVVVTETTDKAKPPAKESTQ